MSNSKIPDKSGVGKESKKDVEDLVFETFYHLSGKEYQCIYQSGMRFYLDDWGSKKWENFPRRWYNEGLLVTNTILKDSTPMVKEEFTTAGKMQPEDDREGFLMHPTKGRVPTYMFYKKHNVHMYFDRDTGSWVRMPIAWELHHSMVRSLVNQVKEDVPTWGDSHDILSLLRACNYDPDECISIYTQLKDDEWMRATKASNKCEDCLKKETEIEELTERLKSFKVKESDAVPGKKAGDPTIKKKAHDSVPGKTAKPADPRKETQDELEAQTISSPSTRKDLARPKFLSSKEHESDETQVSASGDDSTNLQQKLTQLTEENTDLKTENAALKTLLAKYLNSGNK